MYNIRSSLSFLSLGLLMSSGINIATAQSSGDDTAYIPITFGYLGFDHDSIFLAWEPTKTSIEEACSTGTGISRENTGYPTAPLCNQPFNTSDYTGLMALCDPPDGGSQPGSTINFFPTVTGLANSDGVQVENCQPVDPPQSAECYGGGANIRSSWTCEAPRV